MGLLLVELDWLRPVPPRECCSMLAFRTSTPAPRELPQPWVTLSRLPSTPSGTPTPTTCHPSGSSLICSARRCHNRSSLTGSRMRLPSAPLHSSPTKLVQFAATSFFLPELN